MSVRPGPTRPGPARRGPRAGPGRAVACRGPGRRLVARTFQNFRNNKQRVWLSLQLTAVCSTSLSDIFNTRLLAALNPPITSDQYRTSLPRALSDVINRKKTIKELTGKDMSSLPI